MVELYSNTCIKKIVAEVYDLKTYKAFQQSVEQLSFKVIKILK